MDSNNNNNNNMAGNIVRPKQDHPIIQNCFQPKLQSLVILDDSDTDHHNHHSNKNHNKSMPDWLRGLMIDNNPKASQPASPVPDLELKLAGPTRPNLEKTKPSQGRLFGGPITVT